MLFFVSGFWKPCAHVIVSGKYIRSFLFVRSGRRKHRELGCKAAKVCKRSGSAELLESVKLDFDGC